MDLIHELAERGAEAGSMVVATEQLQGRGSRGRAWHSPPGGLWLSALYRPPSTGGLELLSVRVGLAVARALDRLVPTPVRLKWPNDLMLNGRKLGGILCEARWQGEALGWIAVGVGLNVRNPVPGELRETAVSLMELEPDIQLEAVLQFGIGRYSRPRSRSRTTFSSGARALCRAKLARWPGNSRTTSRDCSRPER